MEEKKLFSNDDLADLFLEFEADDNKVDGKNNDEMVASERRYQEIIKKHKEDEE